MIGLMEKPEAGAAQNAAKKSATPQALDIPRAPRDVVMATAARLYGQGLKRAQIARMLREHLLTDIQLASPMDWQMQVCRRKIREWEKSQKFRDLVYQHAVVEADLNTPAILRGVAAKAKRGRVDAARLVLEVTGRHNPRGEQAPTQIALVVNGVPRPLMVEQAVEAEASEVTEDEQS